MTGNELSEPGNSCMVNAIVSKLSYRAENDPVIFAAYATDGTLIGFSLMEAPTAVGKYKVLSARDYQAGTIRNLVTGEETETGLPASNVLYYDLEDDAWLCVRPSGTEPKIKFYYGVKGTSLENAQELSAEMGESIQAMLDAML